MKHNPVYVTFIDTDTDEKQNCIRSGDGAELNFEYTVCGLAWVDSQGDPMLVVEDDKNAPVCEACVAVVEFCKGLRLPKKA